METQCELFYSSDPLHEINRKKYCRTCAGVQLARDPGAALGKKAYCQCSNEECAHEQMPERIRLTHAFNAHQCAKEKGKKCKLADDTPVCTGCKTYAQSSGGGLAAKACRRALRTGVC